MNKGILTICLVMVLCGKLPTGNARAEAGNGEQGSGETRVYLPLVMNAYNPPVIACFYYEDNSDSCDWLTLSFDTGTGDGNKPAYVTQDEGFYNELWTAREFTLNGNPYHVTFWTVINNSFPLDFSGYKEAEAFIYIEMDGNYFVMGIASGWLSGEDYNKWGFDPSR